MYSSLARAGFAIFSCRSFEGFASKRWNNALDIECYGPEHLPWVLSVGVPFMLFITIGLPLAAWVCLYRNRSGLARYNKLE